MTGLFLGLVSLLYIFSALSYMMNGNLGMGIAFLSYAVANYGLYIAGK